MIALLAAALTALLVETPAPGVAGRLPIDPSWSLAPVWDDGQAEVARYDSHRMVYGVDRAFETIVITVKEDLDRRRAVKADAPLEGRDLVTVLKMNIISRIQTENYPYNYMASVFVRRDDPRALVKLAISSQEWCGTTFKEAVTWNGPPHLLFHSYFDRQADGRYPLPLEDGALLEEQLLIVARAADLKRGTDYRFPLYGTLITNSAAPPAAHPVTASIAGEESLATPAGSFQTRRIEIRRADPAEPTEPSLAMTFWIERDGHRALVKFESSDGRSLLLREISRRDYWSR